MLLYFVMALKHRKQALHQFIFCCQLAFVGGLGVYSVKGYFDRDISKKQPRETVDHDIWALVLYWLKDNKKN